jgi:hypothetical protein
LQKEGDFLGWLFKGEDSYWAKAEKELVKVNEEIEAYNKLVSPVNALGLHLKEIIRF